MVNLDGSYLEGGGQIVRTALALSTILQKSFEVKDIRKGRPQPGLKNQHLFCIKALEKLCNAQTEGAELGSTYLKYLPGKIKPKTISIDIGTAGSITLLLQSLLIPSIFSPSKVRLKITGGTDTKWSPQFDYFNNIIIPQLRRYADIEASLEKRGYYPKGQGKVDIKIKPKFKDIKLSNESEHGLEMSEKRSFSENTPKSSISDEAKLFQKEAPQINLTEQHKIVQLKGISHASSDLQKANVAERQASSAKLHLSKLNYPTDIQTQYQDTLSTGSGITLWAIFSKDPDEIDFLNPIRLGVDSLGERGKRAEDVGKEAAEQLLKEIYSRAPVDKHLADNLTPFLALTGGKIKVSEITNHTLTNIYACEQFLGNIFKVDKENNVIETKAF